jgi:putative ABC transport system ATP-binding protein
VDLFRELHKEGTTLVVVTHDPEVGEVAQRQIVLRNGKIHKQKMNENFTGKIRFES